ncbi:MAG: DUF6537 domain-containing protein [Geminicoccaceae bacterium]
MLEAYQDAAYAQRYRDVVGRIREAEVRAVPGSDRLAIAVARNLARLMAYKDEYEVARLYTSGAFAAQLAREIEGAKRLELHLAPPLLASRDPRTGQPEKRRYGPWILHALRLLARLKGLRGTAWDPFGHTAERRLERQLIEDYETLLADLAGRLTPANHDVAVELASPPERIRGFGHGRSGTKEAKAAEAGLLRRLDIEATTPVRPKPAAASLSPDLVERERAALGNAGRGVRFAMRLEALAGRGPQPGDRAARDWPRDRPAVPVSRSSRAARAIMMLRSQPARGSVAGESRSFRRCSMIVRTWLRQALRWSLPKSSTSSASRLASIGRFCRSAASWRRAAACSRVQA